MKVLPVMGLVALVPFLIVAQDIPVASVPLDGMIPVAILPGDAPPAQSDTATIVTDPNASTDETQNVAASVTVVETDGTAGLDSDSTDADSKAADGDESGVSTAASENSPVVAKRDLQSAATGFGGIGIGGGHLGGHGGGYGGGAGFGGGYGGGSGFGGNKKFGGGQQFGSDYGGLNKNVKLVDDKYSNNQYGTKGFKGNQGFQGQQGHVKVNNGNVNKASKKGQFSSLGHASKSAKNDGTVYGNNNVATKFVKGTRFGNKGAHKKGHNTKGFHNTHHKDEYQKSHQFHDDKNDVNFYDKYGDEGAFNNNLAGKQYFNGHHANVFNKNNQGNNGEFLAGHHNVADKGHNSLYGNKGQVGHNSHYGQFGGENYAAGIGKGVHANNNYGGSYGGGGFGKLGGAGGSGHGGGYSGGVGNFGHGGGGYGFGGGGIGY